MSFQNEIMRDFSLVTYYDLLHAFGSSGYRIINFLDYVESIRPNKFVILRHDVDRNPKNALRMAKMERHLGIRASYYFRVIGISHHDAIVREIASMGHEIGYHYEDLTAANGRVQCAIESFEKELSLFRELYPVKTICMHGSPLSRWDNRELWEYCDYRDFGIVGEPYFDIDFHEVLYLSDTGRRWDGKAVSIRDKVASGITHNLKSSADILRSLNHNQLPDKIMMNTHPHRWNDSLIPWLKELIWQNMKNAGKRLLVKRYRVSSAKALSIE